MFETIKAKIWDMLKEKEVSLAMLYDREGRILWQKGRRIKGNTVENGEGFSKSYIRRCWESGENIDRENVVITSANDILSESAYRLVIKCVMIQPAGNDLFLYVDSGKKVSFNHEERIIFRTLGNMLAEGVRKLRVQQEQNASFKVGSPAMQKVKKLVLNYAIVDEPILLKGETGVGKNHTAEQVHINSGRKGNFVVVHTPSINENLFESEIFGHKKGAFTDAKFEKKGLAAEADQGTLFFDEISEIPLSFQTKLLRFIETRKYRMVGDSTEKEADVRIITATNKDLFKSIENGEFREDLYFRLHVLEIEIPPLRQRKEDIRSLVEATREYLRGKEVEDTFWEAILNYRWPGNVRELITVLKRAGIMLESPITGRDIQALIDQGIYGSGNETPDKGDVIWQEIKGGSTFWESLWSRFIDREVDRDLVKNVLKKAFAISGNNFKKMIEILNVDSGDYQKFMSLMYKYKIDPRH